MVVKCQPKPPSVSLRFRSRRKWEWDVAEVHGSEVQLQAMQAKPPSVSSRS